KTFSTLDKHLFNSISEKDRNTFNAVLERLTENLKEIPKNDLFFNYKKTKQSK
ncbi:MAG: hypothetical protein K0S12_777, partial [Bacteroidetes bacterium]|nr:hypothetical protein [Bacteroidota bacterium]